MRETTPEERRNLMAKAIGSSRGNVNYVNTQDELIDAYCKYVKLEYLAREDRELSDRHEEMLTGFLVKLSRERFTHDLPALRLLFKQFMTQH